MFHRLHPARDGSARWRYPIRRFSTIRARVCGISAKRARAGLGFGAPVVMCYMAAGLVPRLRAALLAVGLVLSAGLSLCTGFILDRAARAASPRLRDPRGRPPLAGAPPLLALPPAALWRRGRDGLGRFADSLLLREGAANLLLDAPGRQLAGVFELFAG